jgi:tetratricopeptide (TPR) repeat protein
MKTRLQATGDRRRAGSSPEIILAVTCSLWSLVSSAQSIDYDPRRPNALKPCDEHWYHGREAEAAQCYADLLNSSADLLIQAEAAWRSADVQRANRAFRDAVRTNQRSVYARSRWGRLFLETHQHDEALRLFREALELSPNDVHARLGLAHVYTEQFAGEAEPVLEQVLQEDPNLVEGQLLRARMAMEGGHQDEARSALDQALKAAEAQKLPPLEVYAGRAVLDLARGQDSASMPRNAWVGRSLAFNPHDGAVFEDLAHFEVMRRRYAEATPLLRKAIEVQPRRWSAHAALGANLLRFGQIDEARQHMQVAYQGDPYSPTIVNTLRLLDRADQVDVVTSKVSLPPAAEVLVQLRLDKKESAALQPYVQSLARDSIATFAQRYGFQPKGPITVELYPNHDDFAVRVAALPGIGLLGVTFGELIVMDSPSGRASGDFHWGTTLWHEMAHVFTLSMTNNRVPRWLSEGISVFEEWRTGPTPGVVIAPDVMSALREQRMLPVADLDAGFIRPEYPNQVQVSYTQAGLVCLFIEERWGFDRLPALVRQFEREISTQAAIESTLKIPAKEFDRQFAAFVQQRYATTFARFPEWQQARMTAAKAMEAEDWTKVIDAAQRAIDIYPDDVANDGPYVLLAAALEKSGQRSRAVQTLQRYRERGGWDPSSMRQLAQWLHASNDAAALEVLANVNYADPLNAAQHQLLGEQYLTVGRGEDSMQEFRVLLSLNPQDPATAHFGMARALRALGNSQESRRHLLDALETAPHFKPAQALLLQMIEERKE